MLQLLTLMTCDYNPEDCDLNLIVLLAYDDKRTNPATLLAHSHFGRTWLALEDIVEKLPLPNLHNKKTCFTKILPHFFTESLNSLAETFKEVP